MVENWEKLEERIEGRQIGKYFIVFAHEVLKEQIWGKKGNS